VDQRAATSHHWEDSKSFRRSLGAAIFAPAVPRWQRGAVHCVDKDARYFYVFYAYEARGEDMYKVDVKCSSWRRARIAKRKRKAQIVGTGKLVSALR
jgi:hypothetical protein